MCIRGWLGGRPQRSGAGARPQRLRGARAELHAPRSARPALRRCLCQCRAVPCAQSGTAAGAATTTALPAPGRGAVSAPTRAAMARRAGTVSVTAHFTTGQPGVPG